MKQKEAVYKACHQVIEFEDNDKITPSSDERAEIIAEVAQGLENGDVDFTESARKKYDTPEKIKSYTSGLVSNWLRKDKRLNGNVDYEIKNKGSRTGQGDAQMKELRKLATLHKGDEEKTAQIQKFIDARLEAIKAEKAKAIEIDTDQLPEELKALANG